LIAILAAAAWLARAIPPVRAWDEGGHFYTVTAVQHDHRPPFDGSDRSLALLAAFCTQLPDLSADLDAVTVRTKLIPSFATLTWGLFTQCWGADVRHMVTVQHYLHALTGGPADPVNEAAREILQDLHATLDPLHPDPNTVCAIGFAAHLLGDTYAHRRIDDPNSMYPTGLGHFRDKNRPDHPLYDDARTTLWKGYVLEASEDLESALEDPQLLALDAVPDEVRRVALAAKDPPSDGNEWKEADLIKGLVLTLEGDAATWASYTPALEEVARAAAVSSWLPILTKDCEEMKNLFPAGPQTQRWTCKGTMRTYLQTAVRVFKKNGVPAQCDAEIPVDDEGGE
jgi:hypothetical protein